MIDNRMVTNGPAAINRLLDILEKFKGEGDPMSKRIVLWSREVFRLAKEQSTPQQVDIEKITRIAQEKLYILTTKILVNLLSGDLLCEPILERTFVWEKWVHAEYRKEFDLSPLDDEEMMENPPPHFFAKEMLVWVKSLGALVPERPSSTNVLNQEQMALLSTHSQLRAFKRFSFQATASNARAAESLRRTEEAMYASIFESDAVVARALESSKNIVGQTTSDGMVDVKDSALALLVLEQKMENLKRIYSDSLDNVKSLMDRQREIYEDKIIALEKQIELKGQVDSAAIGIINNEVQNLKSDYKNSISALENNTLMLKEAYAADKRVLEGQLSCIKSQRDSAEASVASLQNSAMQLNSQLQTTNQNLQHAQSESHVLRMEIERLKPLNQQLDRRAQELQRELDNVDDPLCTIL